MGKVLPVSALLAALMAGWFGSSPSGQVTGLGASYVGVSANASWADTSSGTPPPSPPPSDWPISAPFLIPDGARSLATSYFERWQRNVARDPHDFFGLSAEVIVHAEISHPYVQYYLTEAGAAEFAQSEEMNPTAFALPFYVFPIRSHGEIVGGIEIRRNRQPDGTKMLPEEAEYLVFSVGTGEGSGTTRVRETLAEGYVQVAVLSILGMQTSFLLLAPSGQVSVRAEASAPPVPLEQFEATLKSHLRSVFDYRKE